MSSLLSSYKSTMWIVVFVFSGVPLAVSTNPPLPELVTQSPIPLVGVFANKLPSMANPPAGGFTGAVPAGGTAAPADCGQAQYTHPKIIGAIELRHLLNMCLLILKSIRFMEIGP